jgi:transcriptional regulator GlxA family with amidase domain
MNRREFLTAGAGLSAFALMAGDDTVPLQVGLANGGTLKPPAKGAINVAFLVSESSNVIDMSGPWEVFQDVHVDNRGSAMTDMMPFQLFTVAETQKPVRLTGGLHVVPDYAVDNAPPPNLVVVPAMRSSPKALEWLRTVSGRTDLTMSVCTGAFQLGRAGLLKGKPATTHHEFYDAFAREFPDTELKRGVRFVEGAGNIATAGGLTSGIDLALRTVERYFGREIARRTATYLEYTGTGWQTSDVTANDR